MEQVVIELSEAELDEVFGGFGSPSCSNSIGDVCPLCAND
jgi:hypothetical protein